MLLTDLRRCCIAAVFTLAVPAAAFATPIDTLENIAANYNAFLLGNLGSSSAAFGSDTQGAIAVVGNAYINNASIDSNHIGSTAIQVGGNLSANGGSELGNAFVGGDATFAPPTVTGSLVVNGNLTAQGGTISGNVFVGKVGNLSGGATVSGSLTDKGASLTISGGSAPNGIYVAPTTSVNVPSYMTSAVHTSGGPVAPVPPLDLYGTATDLTNASTSLAALTATHMTSNGGLLTITLTQNGLNVVDLSMLSSASAINGINIVTASGVTPTGLIVNVDGASVSFNGGTFSLGSLGANDVLFNFTDATNISLTSLAFEGSLLAPLATVDFISGNFNGALMANNYLGSGELHDVAFTATLPAYIPPTTGNAGTVPEPGSLASLLAGLIGLGLVMCRKARAVPALAR